jgi:hypothetical protein
MPALVRIENRAGDPIQNGDRTLTPFSKALILQLPGMPGGLIWNRPASVLARSADGQEQVIPIQDITRQAIFGLYGACLAFAIAMLLVGGRRRK